MRDPIDARFDAIREQMAAVCADALTDEYGALASAALDALAASEIAPELLRGKASGWACGVVRALGHVNFLSDPGGEPSMPLDALAALFGVSKATAANRDRDVRDALDLQRMHPHWTLPSALVQNPLAWMLTINGIPEDARRLPLDVQRMLADGGYIPFAPADPAAQPPRPRWAEPGLDDETPFALDPDAPRLVLRVTLADVPRPVWRRVVVPSDLPLDGLHEVLQAAMGWGGGHLHAFTVGRRTFGPAGVLDDVDDETAATVGDVLRRRGARLTYLYDFGDGWEHDVVREAERPPDPAAPLFECLDGAGACPPDDCGGPPGYADLLAALADPEHPEHADLLAWAGGPVDPDAFDLDAANRVLADG